MLASGCGTDRTGRDLVEAHARPDWPSFFPPDLLVFAPDRELLGRLRFDADPAAHLDLFHRVLTDHPELCGDAPPPVPPAAGVAPSPVPLVDGAAPLAELLDLCRRAGRTVPGVLDELPPVPPAAQLSADDQGRLLCAVADRLANDGRWDDADAVWDTVLTEFADSPLAHRARYNRLERRSTWVSTAHPALMAAPRRSVLPLRVPHPERRARLAAKVRSDPRYRLVSTGLPVAWVPPGTFTMGGTPALSARELPTRRVTLSRGCWVSAHPVSRRIWARFQPHRYTAEQLDGLRGSLPVMGVSLSEARAFCAFWSAEVGAPVRLLTEAEWERAARGGREGCAHPWGDAPVDADRCNAAEPFAVPVGCYPPNDYGLFDMVGNGLEWTADLYREQAYAETSAEVVDPTGPAEPDLRDHYACRGGFFGASFTEQTCRVSFRLGFEDNSAEDASATVGVRVALDHLPAGAGPGADPAHGMG